MEERDNGHAKIKMVASSWLMIPIPPESEFRQPVRSAVATQINPLRRGMMKKQLFGTFAILSLLFALTVVSVQAQSGSRITVHVPFAFQIGNKTLPAGDY